MSVFLRELLRDAFFADDFTTRLLARLSIICGIAALLSFGIVILAVVAYCSFQGRVG